MISSNYADRQFAVLTDEQMKKYIKVIFGLEVLMRMV